jgi:SAM-dependent methyltransferase
VVARAVGQKISESLGQQIIIENKGGAAHVTAEFVLARAAEKLAERTAPHIRSAINATGIILHTGLGRAVLPDSAVERVILVHALEMTNDPAALLREVWRVLAAGGRLLVVVPNRRGLWARMDTTPFGHGRPYSRSQINQLLRETWFTPTGWSEALYVPPVARGWFLRSAVAWERTGATLSAPFAGVHMVEATKQVYRAIPARRVKRRLVPALEPALAPSPGGAARTITD